MKETAKADIFQNYMAKEERYVKRVQNDMQRISMVRQKTLEERRNREMQKNSHKPCGPKDKLQEMKRAQTMKQIEAKNKKTALIEQQKKARAAEV